jgi:hypothetical protein
LKDQWSPLQAKLGLALWGLAGPWNHLKLKRLQADTESAETALVDYYIYTYGVEAADAAHAAGIAVDTILKESFYFYDYGEQERKGKGSPAEIERGIRSEADNFARLPMDQRDATDATDLIRAAILAGASKSDIATLIAAGAELGGRDTQYNDRFPDAKEPALFFSLERPEIAALLIKDGVDVNQTNAFGKTALMYAAHLNLDDTLELLLGAKAAVNATTTNGPANSFDSLYTIRRSRRSALMYAAENASKKLIDRLIDAGADVHATDSEGNGISFYLGLNTILTSDEKNAIQGRLN